MRKLRIPIPNLAHTEKTFLDADYATGASLLTVVNNYGFANDDFAIVGNPGEEKTETKDVTSQTGNATINLSASLKFNHNKSTPVYRYEYDQYEIYRYRASAWSLISTSNIQWDKRETIYIDADGLSTDGYRFRLKNSAKDTYSDYSPTVAATGFTDAQVGRMIENVRTILGDQDRIIIKTDEELIRQFNRAQDIIRAVRNDWWFLRKESQGVITTLVDTRRYGLATNLADLDYIDTVRYRYQSGAEDVTYQLERKSFLEMDQLIRDNDAASDDWPEAYTLDPPDTNDAVGYIALDKKSKTAGVGSFYIRFYKTMADLDDVADATDVPLPSILEDYALAYGFRLKGDDARAKTYEERFYGPKASKSEAPLNREPTGIRLLEMMQSNKGKALGQPIALKVYRGRGAMHRYFNTRTGSRDAQHENYW